MALRNVERRTQNCYPEKDPCENNRRRRILAPMRTLASRDSFVYLQLGADFNLGKQAAANSHLRPRPAADGDHERSLGGGGGNGYSKGRGLIHRGPFGHSPGVAGLDAIDEDVELADRVACDKKLKATVGRAACKRAQLL